MWSMGSNFTGGTEGAWAATTSYQNLTTCAGDQMDVVGATLEFAHVQLEEGKNATDFDHRSYAEELALCQRYYQKVPNSSYIYDHCVFHYSTSFYASHTFMQPMRASPSVTITTDGSYYEAGSSYNHGSITVRNVTPEALNFHASTGGGTNGYAGGIYFRYTADAEL